MAKINILDSSVFNRIAAGEVVDRPYSVVKEFVENSIDSGASEIVVEIERGGKELVRVSDNGSGIEKDDFRSAFLPHATSKIARVEDLDVISTLGFRGEALASIASVAKVTVKSRAKGSDCAYSIICNGGLLGEMSPCARDEGTEICAENLFYNTPVRAKFLKTDKGEETEISNFVSRFILGNPKISFRYIVDGNIVLQSFGEGLEEAVAAVYGAQVLRECYCIKTIKHGISISGYIGKPSYTKANRTYQSTFVNGRYVVNTTISSAISNAYASYLMKRQYPFYVLFIDVPPEVVDVNVHPNKADVRFENNQVIYSSIYSVISAVLDGNASALEYIVGAGQDDVSPQNTDNRITLSDIKSNKSTGDSSASQLVSDLPSVATSVGQQKINLSYKIDRPVLQSLVFEDSGAKSEFSIVKPEQNTGDQNKGFVSSSDDIFEENKMFIWAAEKKAQQQKIIFDRAEYRGCLFNTYLFYEVGDDCYLIDQHAAHERLLFDRLKKEMERREVVKQPMLVPYVLKVNAAEAEFLTEHLQILEEIGFECEQFGIDSFKVSTVPMELQDISLSSFFAEVLNGVGGLKAIRLSDILRDRLASAACKHAVKGGMALSDSEKNNLFDMLAGDMGLKCPHGRPIAVKLSRYEIEKMFKRIV